MRFFRSLAILLLLLPAAFAQDVADKFLQDGAQLLQRRKYDDAYKSFEKANKVRGEKCYICLLRMALAKMYMQDEKAALKLADRSLAVADKPGERADADSVRGELLLFFAGDNQKKLAEAEQAFRDAAKEDSSVPIFHQRLGFALMRQSKDDEGKKELQLFLDQSPDPKDADRVKKWIADPRRTRFNFAPDFSVTTLKGENLTLSGFAGKVVLIDFWGTWCPPCRASIPELLDMFKRYPTDKLVILSVSSDEEEQKWKQFVVDHKMEWHQYIDLDKHVLSAFNVHEFPTYVLIDKDGIIRERISGLNEQETLAGRLREPLKKIFSAEPAAK